MKKPNKNITSLNEYFLLKMQKEDQMLNDFEAKFPIKKIAVRDKNLWRYAEAIPLDQKNKISFNEGFTPLLAEKIAGKTVFIKQEQLFSSGSYKDRGATVLISKVQQLGIKKILNDSSGNAGCAIAAYAAKAKINCEIYVPENTSAAKTNQIKAYGATIKKIKGDREDTAKAAMKAAQKTYYASHCFNPWFFEGTKTFAFEVCEQLGWKAPDAVILPCGNGTLVLGCYKGFVQLAKAGVITKIPKIIAIQAANCSPLAEMFSKKLSEIPSIKKNITIAEGIAIANPPRAIQIIDAIKKTNGFFIKVSETEIKKSWKEMALRGHFIEHTSAATIAGLEKFVKNNDEKLVVSLFSGHGLKNH